MQLGEDKFTLSQVTPSTFRWGRSIPLATIRISRFSDRSSDGEAILAKTTSSGSATRTTVNHSQDSSPLMFNPAVSKLTAPPVSVVQDWRASYDGSHGPLIDMSQAIRYRASEADKGTANGRV